MASLPFCLFPFPACLTRPQHSQPFASAVNFARSATSHLKPRRLLPTCALTRHCSRSPPAGLQQRSTSIHFVPRTHWFCRDSVRGSLSLSASLRPHTPLTHPPSFQFSRKGLVHSSEPPRCTSHPVLRL